MVLDKHHARRGLAKTEEIDEEVMPVHEDGYPDPEGVFRQPWGKRQWVVELAHCVEWLPLFSSLFKRRAHVNVQEGKVVITLAKLAAREFPGS